MWTHVSLRHNICFKCVFFVFFCFIIACDPKLMPTFPQHRNLKNSKVEKTDTGAGDQTNNLPAISDLVILNHLVFFHCQNFFCVLFYSWGHW